MSRPAENVIDPEISTNQEVQCDPELDRTAQIAECAFYKAEKRGFEPGHELDDWLEAEREF